MTANGTVIEGRTGSWEIILGLEVHAQVVSKSKLFSGAATEFGAEPNTQVSLVDAAMAVRVLRSRVTRSGDPVSCKDGTRRTLSTSSTSS